MLYLLSMSLATNRKHIKQKEKVVKRKTMGSNTSTNSVELLLIGSSLAQKMYSKLLIITPKKLRTISINDLELMQIRTMKKSTSKNTFILAMRLSS